MKTYVNVHETLVIAPNFKRRLSGVTSTIVQLMPLQRALGLNIAAFGPGLPDVVPVMRLQDIWRLWFSPVGSHVRIWHARRNVEMIAGLVLRHILRMKVKLVFTSAAQRDHRPFTKWLIRRMDRVIATSARSGAFLTVPHDVILHGIDTEAFHPASTPQDYFAASGLPGKFAVGCSGRIRHQKGTDLFVEAMIALLPQFPDWTAIITGRTTSEHQGFEQELRDRIAASGLQDRILFLGEVTDIKVWYRRFSLFVAPSRNEGFGLTPLEAMASGTTVVTSDAGAYAELVVDSVGAVVPADNLAALTAAIQDFMATPDKTLETGLRAREHVVEKFRLENEAKALIAVYRELLEQSGISRNRHFALGI